MDKMALDALNKGWALGLATRVRRVDADLEAALARGVPRQPEPALEMHLDLHILATMLISPRARH